VNELPADIEKAFRAGFEAGQERGWDEADDREGRLRRDLEETPDVERAWAAYAAAIAKEVTP
jgi:hypothetical protein